MKTIKFSESELEFLQSHYELELLDAENYVVEIKNILKKIGVIEKEVAKEKPVKKTGRKVGRPKKEKTPVIEETAPVVKPAEKETLKKATKTAGKKAAKVAKKTEAIKAEKKPVIKKALKPLVKLVDKKVAKKNVKTPAKNTKPETVASSE